MQDGHIEASYLWTADEYVAVQRAVHKHGEWPPVRLGYGCLFAALFCSGLPLLFSREGPKGPLSPSMRALGLGICSLMVYLIYINFLGRKRIWRRAYRKAETTQGFSGKTTF